MKEEEKKDEKKEEPLFTGRSSNGRFVIKKGDQEIVILPWEIKHLKKALEALSE